MSSDTGSLDADEKSGGTLHLARDENRGKTVAADPETLHRPDERAALPLPSTASIDHPITESTSETDWTEPSFSDSDSALAGLSSRGYVVLMPSYIAMIRDRDND
jgi:hypothetical protein